MTFRSYVVETLQVEISTSNIANYNIILDFALNEVLDAGSSSPSMRWPISSSNVFTRVIHFARLGASVAACLYGLGINDTFA